MKEALLLCCHTGLCCSSSGSALEGGQPLFSVILVSRMTMTSKMLPTVDVASEAGDSQRQPLVDDGTQTGEEEEGRAQSHWEVAGSSQEMSRGEEAERGEVGEEGIRSQKADGAGLFAGPEVPGEDSPSSACLAWGAELEVQKNL